MNYTNITFNDVDYFTFDTMSDIEIIRNYCSYASQELVNILLFCLIVFIVIEVFFTVFRNNRFEDTIKTAWYYVLLIALLVMNSYTLPYLDFATERFFKTINYIIYIVIAIFGYLFFRSKTGKKVIEHFQKEKR